MYKILFIDDEINVLEYLPLAICWEDLGITQIFTASDAERGLRIVKKERPDIAVVDVEMPGKNGLDFCREARELQPEMILVILSAFDRFDYAKRAISMGVNDYLLKPVDEKELLNLMKKIVSGLERSRKNTIEKKTMQAHAMEKAAGNYLLKLFHHEKPAEDLENDFPALGDYKHVMIDSVFGPEKGKCKGYPGHKIAEMALIRLYEVTGEKKYLRLAQFFIDEREKSPGTGCRKRDIKRGMSCGIAIPVPPAGKRTEGGCRPCGPRHVSVCGNGGYGQADQG